MKVLTKRKQKHFSSHQQTNKRIESLFFDKKKKVEVKKKNELLVNFCNRLDGKER
jgi:hypothetical protein